MCETKIVDHCGIKVTVFDDIAALWITDQPRKVKWICSALKHQAHGVYGGHTLPT